MPDTHTTPKPRLAPLNWWTETYGGSRATAYRYAAAGRLRLVKMGARTMVDVASAEALAAALPEMKPQRGRPRKDAA